MRGVLHKIVREVWLGTLLFGAGFFIIEVLLNMILPQVQDQISGFLLQMPFARTLLAALLGTDFGSNITAQIMHAFVWVHPVVLATLWAHEIVLCTRLPAGEVDRGTIDVLLGLPVSRMTLYLGETIVWLVSGVFLLVVGFAGYLVGSAAMAPEHRVEMSRIMLLLVNLFGVYVAVGGTAFLVSACSNRRGRAIAIVFGLVLASFLLSFLAGFWEPAQRVVFLSVLDYYKPALILRSGVAPVGDLAILVGFGFTTWLLGGAAMRRRSLCTV